MRYSALAGINLQSEDDLELLTPLPLLPSTGIKVCATLYQVVGMELGVFSLPGSLYQLVLNS